MIIKKIQIELIILNLLSISLLILSILYGPIKTIPYSAAPGEPIEEAVIPPIYFLYQVLFIFIISILILISDYRKTRIKFEILALPDIEVDLINLKGEDIQAIKIPIELAKDFLNIQDNQVNQEIRKRVFEIGKKNGEIREKDGIYIFIGFEYEQTRLYIGQSGTIINRIKNHDKLENQIYNIILIFTCPGDNFGGSILRELESRLILSLKEQGDFQIDNTQEKNKTPSDFFDSHIVDRYHYLILKTLFHYCH